MYKYIIIYIHYVKHHMYIYLFYLNVPSTTILGTLVQVKSATPSKAWQKGGRWVSPGT